MTLRNFDSVYTLTIFGRDDEASFMYTANNDEHAIERSQEFKDEIENPESIEIVNNEGKVIYELDLIALNQE